jgi:Rrf2 family iron-sulfur cluster assembly transcriptional regulator
MFKISRKSEYALLAVQVLARKSPESLVSVAELATTEFIPPDILAKVLQALKRTGVLEAAKGSGGGYKLARPLAEIRFLDVVRPFEEQMAVVACQDGSTVACDRERGCQLRDPMAVLNAYIMRQVETLTMDLFLAPAQHQPVRVSAHPFLTTQSLVTAQSILTANAMLDAERAPSPGHLSETNDNRSIASEALGRRAEPAAPRVQP